MRSADFEASIREGPARPGEAPGLLHAPEGSPPSRIDLLLGRADGVTEEMDVSAEDLAERVRAAPDALKWIDVNGLGTPEVLVEVGRAFGFHRLSLEDVVNLDQRPKLEIFEDHVFCVVQVPYLGENNTIDFEQISLFAGAGFLVTFQASAIPRLKPLRERFGRGTRLRGSGADYALYAAIDVLTDASFPVLAGLEDELDRRERGLLDRSQPLDLGWVHGTRRMLLELRRMLWSLRDIPAGLPRVDLPFLASDTRPYFRDVEDHATRLLERTEQLRESCTGLFELHHALAGEKLNEVMKLLTIFSTMFIPLTFVAGVYGMNFEHMPELHWRWGYPVVWGINILIVLGMLALFRRKGWLGGRGGA